MQANSHTGTVQLLDCTLRDGGFVNEWNFGLSTIRDILYRLGKANIDIVEVGFIDARKEYNKNLSMIPHTKYIQPMLRLNNLPQPMFVAMVDYGTCPIENIALCADACIDGIRVIFKKKDLDDALNFCLQVQDKGYKLFVQPVSITTYTEEEIISLVEKVNQLHPYGMSLVDTYGLLLKKQLLRYFSIVDMYLDEDIQIGYHAHNNFQLAYANCMELLDIVQGKRGIILDGSIYGMGKGAGNAPTELIALYLNNAKGKEYDIDQLLEIIDIHISRFSRDNIWGYSLHYFLSASNDCHPAYVKDFIERRTLSIRSVNQLLSSIPVAERLTYDAKLANKLYLNHQITEIDDREGYKHLRAAIAERDVLILSPGPNLREYKAHIKEYIRQHNAIVIAANFIPVDMHIDYVFVANTKRYSQFTDVYDQVPKTFKVLASSFVTSSRIPIDYYFNYDSLMIPYQVIQDNSTLIVVNILQRIGRKKIFIAGFDGFSNTRQNYASDYLNFVLSDEKITALNAATKSYLQDIQNDVDIYYITPSLYSE